MCGRYTASMPRSVLRERFAIEVPEGWTERYNLAPAQQLLAARRRDGTREAALLRWGLVPSWAKSPSASYKMINARAETLLEKPSYRGLVGSRRCLIPADGFYEWQVVGGRKQPIRFTLVGGEPFAFAGLWTVWTDKATGERIESATIITTRANELVAPVHDRMPVILTFDQDAVPGARCQPLRLPRLAGAAAVAARERRCHAA
jgi:putative SOS response-associated peptidase YedK